MNGPKWTTEHKQLLKTDMTTEELVRVTGRTPEAVRRARYTYTGHFVGKGQRQIETKEEKLFQAEERYHKLQREQHLKDLCKQLGVRIGGMK